ncbi:MAG TPA: sulfotransferase [Isosphaeraceae bacterium]|jgi:hypothetical protein|nr:sulfotransferase [Isosphaeraceae bacterium]
MSWREAFIVRFGPGYFGGITVGLWLKVLRENHFAVERPYWGRAVSITAGSLSNTPVAWWEEKRYGPRVRQTKVDPPLFILGIWRSGTTLLHNLLAQDDRFAYPNNYQVCYPRTFLCTESRRAKILGWILPKTRPQDNVSIGIQEPQEDEFAFCSLTGRSIIMGWAFPRRAEHYDRYLTFRDASEQERNEWKLALRGLLQKLAFKYGKPLVLKSPGHTCRIKMLLEVFPDARFVHIHRNPYDVFQSTQHLMRKISPWIALQRPDFAGLEDTIIRQYKQVYDAYFEERDLIPKSRLHEIRFEDLETDPIGQLRGLYRDLDLPDFEHVQPALKSYVESLSGYKKNEFPELSADLRERIGREWRRCFEEWGYAAENSPCAVADRGNLG